MITQANVILPLERYLQPCGQFFYQMIDGLAMKTIREADSGLLFYFNSSPDDIVDRSNTQDPEEPFGMTLLMRPD